MIAKLDRLSRNAAFLLALRDSGVRFVAVDMPEANDLTVGIMALVAHADREAISPLTKEALAVAKARGQPERCREPATGGQRRCGASRGSISQCKGVRGRLGAGARGYSSRRAHLLRAIASELTTRGIRTRRGGAWNVGNVRTLVARHLAQQ